MALTRNFKLTVVERVERDPVFAQALLDEAATLFLNGEPETVRLILRDLVNATISFEQLSTITDKPSKSLHRMLSPAGNPSMDNLAAILHAIRERLNVNLEAHSVAARVVPASFLFGAHSSRLLTAQVFRDAFWGTKFSFCFERRARLRGSHACLPNERYAEIG